MLKQPVRTSISDFIKTTMGSQFVIPVYQRTYTWIPEKETMRFMHDVEKVLENRDHTHFLGIIIYMESKISTMLRQFQIVDGQQRMTTTFIFLLALKRVAEEKGNRNVAGMIDDYYLYNRHMEDAFSLRLKPAVDSDDVYAKLVYGSVRDLNAKEKESGVFRNYHFIHKRILELAKKYPLMDILDCLSRMDILEFPLSDRDNAQEIFESINSTGAPLTSADLIRNYILMNHTDAEQERYYKMYWQSLEDYYPESRKLEEFFRFFLAIKTYDLLNRRDVYDGFKQYWSSSKDKPEKKLQEINRYCRYYHEIYEGEAEDKDIEQALMDFRITDSRMPAPFLMEVMQYYYAGKIEKKTVIAVIRLIESYLVRRALCANDNSNLSHYFPTLLRTVIASYQKNKKEDFYSLTRLHLVTYNRGKTLAMPTDEQLRTQLKEVNAYSLMIVRPVLERIEHYESHAKVEMKDLNIEHILPQNPNVWWKKNCGIEDEDEYSFYANLIGNLTLCAEYDNSRMGNEDFSFKKKILAKTNHIRLNTEIIKKKSWTKKDILKRCEELAEQIIRIYPYREAKTRVLPKQKINYSKNAEMILSLNTPSVTAQAIRHHNGDVEVLPGSVMKAYGKHEMKGMQDIYRSMEAKGIFHETDNNRVQFAKSWHFFDLNIAAQFLMHRGGENTSMWKKEDGSSYLQDEETNTIRKQVKKKTPSRLSRARRNNVYKF